MNSNKVLHKLMIKKRLDPIFQESRGVIKTVGFQSRPNSRRHYHFIVEPTFAGLNWAYLGVLPDDHEDRKFAMKAQTDFFNSVAAKSGGKTLQQPIESKPNE